MVVIRAELPLQSAERISQLHALGVRHVELAFRPHPSWSEQCRELCLRYSDLMFGAASVCSSEALACVAEAGLSYAFSPVIDAELLAQASDLGITLVPGVMTPSEVHRAMLLGCRIIKLYPAVVLGPAYWRLLEAPLGPLPFAVAAGGLRVGDVPLWLRSGVDAVALGQGLFDDSEDSPSLDPGLGPLIEQLSGSVSPLRQEKISH